MSTLNSIPTPEQVKRLNTIGFSWDPLAEQWEKAFKV